LYSSAAVGALGGAHLYGGTLGNWAGAATDCIKVTPDKQEDWAKHDVTYPSNYANTCAMSGAEPGSYHCTWVTGHKDAHKFEIGYSYNSKWNSEKWCTDKFCWVDPCKCNKLDITKSSWLNGHYSYSMCGAKDSYTPVSCDANKDETKCTAVTGCKWVNNMQKCEAQTGAETMVSLRTALKCPDPTTVPTDCACTANTEAKVTCNAANKKLWDGTVNKRAPGNWGGQAEQCIKVTPDKQDDWAKHDFDYPSNYANTCDQSGKEPGSYHCTWVAGKEKTHKFAVGDSYNSKWDSESWCSDNFCWVDPCNCDKLDVTKSSWLNGYYSYSMCGSTDKYTPVACDTYKDETKCTAVTGCKWDTTCKAQTGAEAMLTLRKKMGCTNPETLPTSCSCTPNKEPKKACGADNMKTWTFQPPAKSSGGSGTDSVSSDATTVKIGTMTAFLLLSLAK